MLDAAVDDDLRALFDAIAAEERVEYTFEVEWSVPPTPFAAAIKDRADALCRERGYSSRRLWAGAGHDSQYLAWVTPTAMIFTPTIGGLSHCETEDAPWPDIARAADILLALAAELANG